MVWSRLDDQLYDHPKVAEISTEVVKLPLAAGAMGLYAMALSWCGKHQTDGVVPKSQPAKLFGAPVDNLVAELLRVGFWEKNPKGFYIHDYLDYNPSKAQIEAASRARSAGGRRGALARWSGIDSLPHSLPHSSGYSLPHGSSQLEAIGELMAQGMASAWPPDAPNPNPSSKEDIEEGKPVNNSGAGGGSDNFKDIDFGEDETTERSATTQKVLP